jgi:hypothetical protein
VPIPVNTDFYLAMVVFSTTASSDEGGFVNTWFFQNDLALGSASQAATDITTVLQAFYSDAFGAGGKSISQLMSPVVDRAAGAECRVYDLGQASPRSPIINTISLDTAQSTTPLPNECSIVLSFHSEDPTTNGGTLSKRRRGRLYLGPMGAGTLDTYASGMGDARVKAETLNTIELAAEDVLGSSEDVTWMQYSRVADEFNAVTQGFVDNAFDTQRRRGFAPTVRTVWGG